MKTQRNFKCKVCGIFSVAYDTRDRRLFKIFPCKCGKVEVSARGVDSFAIFKGDNFVEDLLQEEINPTVEYYPEDYLTLPGEIWGMMEKAEELGNKINDTDKPGEYYSDISDGMVTLELSGLSAALSVIILVALSTSEERISSLMVMLINKRFAPAIEVSSSGLAITAFAASFALSLPEP